MTSGKDKALSEAVKVLFLDDSSDFQTALWKIVFYLGGEEATDLLQANEGAAYDKYCKDKEPK